MSRLSQYISELGYIKRVVRKMESLVLPGFEGLPFYDVMSFFFKQIGDGQLANKAAAISFFFLLAIPPTCIFLFTLLPFIPLHNIENTLYMLVASIAPNQKTYLIVHDLIYDFIHTQRTGLLSFSFLLAIFYSSTAVLGILRSFNKDHPAFKKRNVFQLRWMAIKLNSLLIILLLVSVSLLVAQSSLSGRMLAYLHVTGGVSGLFITLVRWVIIILLFFTVISVIYTLGPAIKKRWKFISAGSTLATVLTILSTLGFSYYVNNFSSYNKIYGSIGSVIVLMTWIYINSFVLLIGFELNASIDMMRQEAEARKEERAAGDTGIKDMPGLS